MAVMTKLTGGILGYMTRHRTAANLFLILMLLAGAVSFPQMRAQFFPDVVVDNVTVSVRWDGAGPEDVDRSVVQVLDPALLTVDGVTDTSASATEGRATVTLEFEPGWDMAQAADDVQIAVDGVVSRLPADVDDPTVRRGQWRDRVTDVVISGPVGVDQLGLFADEFVGRLFAAGVTRTTIRGVAAGSVLVEVPSLSLVRYDITMADISRAIAAEVSADPAGDVTGNARVRTGVEKRQARDIASIILRSNADGSKLAVGDLATVSELSIDRDRAYFVADSPAISIRVDRSPQGDAIEIQSQVAEVAQTLTATLPTGVEIELIRTRSEAISARLNMMMENAIEGLALVLILLFLFLNVRTAFWVALGIPAAISAAMALMYVSGLTINMISLFALIITLGIVVDDAIVVGEHADYRARTLRESPFDAAENAARRMFTPVFSATLTTVIAFFGLVAIGGRFGDLIADIPFTVVVVLIASLAECFLILPNHMAHSIVTNGKTKWYDWPSRLTNAGLDLFKAHAFRPFVRFVVWARYPVIAGLFVVFSTQAVLFINGDVQWRFFNAPERGSVTGNFAMAPGATRDDSLAQMRAMQDAVGRVETDYIERYGRSPVAFVMAEIGGNTGRGLAGTATKDADQLGSIAVELIDPDLRPYSSFAFVADLQDAVTRHPAVETISFRGWRQGPGGDALDVRFSGADAPTLKSASESLQTALAQFPEVSAVQDNLAYDKEEIVLELTPQGLALGLTIDDLGQVLRNRLNGIEAASYPDGARSATVRVELPAGELTADFLDRVLVRTASGDYVPLADIVTVETRTGFSTVRRENGIQVISVTGDISEDDPARAEAITQLLESEILPRIAEETGVAFDLAGLAEQEDQFAKDARTGLILTLAGIFLVLAWIFASWTRPIVVMAVIPFGLIGTIFGHWFYGVPLSLFSVVGLIGMVGIIINDSIVLVTTIDEYEKDRGLVPSIVDGVTDRLRPVLLTTLTTVLGLYPLLNEPSTQAQFLKPTVITLVFGLAFGMVLVLIIVPALMAIQRDVADLIAGYRRSLKGMVQGRGVPFATAAVSLAVAGLFAVTLGYGAFYDAQGPVTAAGLDALSVVAALAGSKGDDAIFWLTNTNLMAGAFVIFVIATAISTLVTYGAVGFALGIRGRRLAS
ncbi:MAG: efflux RND transporter permease subunit [Pseudomonadota bacterium]